MERKIGERSYLNENWIKADKSISEYPFDTARMLKEAGFDMPTSTHYYNSGEVWQSSAPEDYNDDKSCKACSRPTQALAARWLREVYNVAIYSLYDDDIEQWFYVVDAFTKNPVINGFQSGS